MNHIRTTRNHFHQIDYGAKDHITKEEKKKKINTGHIKSKPKKGVKVSLFPLIF